MRRQLGSSLVVTAWGCCVVVPSLQPAASSSSSPACCLTDRQLRAEESWQSTTRLAGIAQVATLLRFTPQMIFPTVWRINNFFPIIKPQHNDDYNQECWRSVGGVLPKKTTILRVITEWPLLHSTDSDVRLCYVDIKSPLESWWSVSPVYKESKDNDYYFNKSLLF